MRNPAAFTSEVAGDSFDPLPYQAEGQPIDADGLVIPGLWQPVPKKWEKLAIEFRRKRSREYVEELIRISLLPPPKPKKERTGPPATRFTTDYAIAWGRKQGWTLIDRERYDRLAKRHYDLMLGMDALMQGPNGIVGVQGAGKGEKAEHYRRFNDRGGVTKARARHMTVVYVEFVRGQKAPILEEWWA